MRPEQKTIFDSLFFGADSRNNEDNSNNSTTNASKNSVRVRFARFVLDYYSESDEAKEIKAHNSNLQSFTLDSNFFAKRYTPKILFRFFFCDFFSFMNKIARWPVADARLKLKLQNFSVVFLCLNCVAVTLSCTSRTLAMAFFVQSCLLLLLLLRLLIARLHVRVFNSPEKLRAYGFLKFMASWRLFSIRVSVRARVCVCVRDTVNE